MVLEIENARWAEVGLAFSSCPDCFRRLEFRYKMACMRWYRWSRLSRFFFASIPSGRAIFWQLTHLFSHRTISSLVLKNYAFSFHFLYLVTNVASFCIIKFFVIFNHYLLKNLSSYWNEIFRTSHKLWNVSRVTYIRFEPAWLAPYLWRPRYRIEFVFTRVDQGWFELCFLSTLGLVKRLIGADSCNSS